MALSRRERKWRRKDARVIARLRADLAAAEVAVRECEEGWSEHCAEREREAPLTKQGRAAWWASIENSVQKGNATGHTAMMELPATDVQRLLELLEAAETQRDLAIQTVENIQGKVAMYDGMRLVAEKALAKVVRERDVFLKRIVWFSSCPMMAEPSHRCPQGGAQYCHKNYEKCWREWTTCEAAKEGIPK
jgi:hypothetical protein